jgi:hypothetical protein
VDGNTDTGSSLEALIAKIGTLTPKMASAAAGQ